MPARLHSVTLEGIEGIVCEVEVDVARGGDSGASPEWHFHKQLFILSTRIFGPKTLI